MKKTLLMTGIWLTTVCGSVNTAAQPINRITINPYVHYQTIDHFGASDCWSVQYLGKVAPDNLKNQAADFLFSTKNDREGNPKGIGLSLWRFNIGAGSAENPANRIGNPWHQTSCILDSTGQYDFHKQPGQIWFLKAARERGCQQFLGFCNSPPYFLTQNGQAFNIGRSGHTLNLKEDQYEAFARFLAQFCRGFKKEHGITFNYISPFNEPEWDWCDTKQEGTPCSTREIARFYQIFDRELSCQNLNHVSIVGPECAHFKYLYSQNTGKPAIENQIERFYNVLSADYIGNLPHVEKVIAAHSYWTTQWPDLVRVRKELHQKLKQYPVRFWQSELCIMSNDQEIGGGGRRDRSMKTALYVARIIHHDLTVANASSWQWWLAVSPSDYKDGLLYIDDNREQCEHLYDSRLLWSFGNFSRFIRPGAIRIAVSGTQTDDPHGVMVSAFQNENRSIVVVVINYSEAEQSISLAGCEKRTAKAYITSDRQEDRLRYTGKYRLDSPLKIPARSIVTYVI